MSIIDILFPNFFFISYLSDINAYIIFIIVLVATTLLKLTEDWFYFNATENRILKLKNTHIETQLSALRAQMNPHFLFNSLNVIYSMAIEQKKDVTKAIVELSNLLRYVIYDSDTERVTLKQEVELIKNYITFQSYRSLNPELIEFNTNIESIAFKIYPMLLLPLLENSFKYGLSPDDSASKIKIKLIQQGKGFYFEVSNKNNDYNNDLDKDYSGVGLKTLEDNLNLVYPNQHEFKIENTSDLFKVTIKIIDEDQ
ncbi:sensor histidine kinase [Winogradskyella sp. A3E31]|uniref:sensor histidine kinase n=1 Tax=Winogradskyella sp. A3E31 TaxID=3349637 RepID=UPI00398ACA78